MAKKIVFLLGSAHMSGGTYVIFQHAEQLQKLGIDVTIALVFMTFEEYISLRNSDTCWHPAVKTLKFIHINDANHFQFDVAIFTWWATLFYFEKINAASYIYFIQSIESRFYPKNETFMQDLVNRTYQLGLPVITEAKWIKNYLEKKYNNRCELVTNGILKSLYNTQGQALANKTNEKLRILVEGPIDAPYKNVPKTIELCKKSNVGEIWLLTSSAIENYPGVDRVFSQVPISAVPEIYRSCDVLVKLSYVEGMFGPPLEIFHCGGTAIVYDVTGFDEYIVHDSNALVVKTGDESAVIDYLKHLQKDRAFLSHLIEGAHETAKKWIDWEESSNRFALALEILTASPLTEKEKVTLTQNIVRHLRERVEVILLRNNMHDQIQMEAHPLYESGSYELFIPVTSGETTIGIIFGKSYKRLYIPKIELIGIGHSQPEGKVDARLDKMVKNLDQSIDCHSDLSMLIIHMNIRDKNNANNTDFRLNIEFKPFALREKVNTTVTQSETSTVS